VIKENALTGEFPPSREAEECAFKLIVAIRTSGTYAEFLEYIDQLQNQNEPAFLLVWLGWLLRSACRGEEYLTPALVDNVLAKNFKRSPEHTDKEEALVLGSVLNRCASYHTLVYVLQNTTNRARASSLVHLGGSIRSAL
jgi:hypothetical protein